MPLRSLRPTDAGSTVATTASAASTDRQVDGEHRAPADVVGEEAAGQRAGDEGHAHQARQRALQRGAAAPAEEVGDEDEREAFQRARAQRPAARGRRSAAPCSARWRRAPSRRGRAPCRSAAARAARGGRRAARRWGARRWRSPGRRSRPTRRGRSRRASRRSSAAPCPRSTGRASRAAGRTSRRRGASGAGRGTCRLRRSYVEMYMSSSTCQVRHYIRSCLSATRCSGCWTWNRARATSSRRPSRAR